MKKYQSFSSENFQLLEVKVSIYLNRRVFVMYSENSGTTLLRRIVQFLGAVVKPPPDLMNHISTVRFPVTINLLLPNK